MQFWGLRKQIFGCKTNFSTSPEAYIMKHIPPVKSDCLMEAGVLSEERAFPLPKAPKRAKATMIPLRRIRINRFVKFKLLSLNRSKWSNEEEGKGNRRRCPFDLTLIMVALHGFYLLLTIG
ncbi:unnamed protein product [Lepeophtheirus salmonis]|uniref:(salmon louse) hypothetical protein n=1 Tax=Lepeophtheirus salmonis TaxID=72036 RepID=A0A7R8D2C0_LEPSM|nr:unnamed protein product [Lepeophtheirus salmonis]CAF3001758.1 unnamed protein product [Lepeophtheirus salmonis]